MKRGILALVIAVTLTCAFAQTFAAERSVIAVKGTATVDGELNEALWKAAQWYDIDEDTCYVENGAFKGFNGKFAVAYDQKTLYFAFIAKDDKLVGTRSGADIWNCNSQLSPQDIEKLKRLEDEIHKSSGKNEIFIPMCAES